MRNCFLNSDERRVFVSLCVRVKDLISYDRKWNPEKEWVRNDKGKRVQVDKQRKDLTSTDRDDGWQTSRDILNEHKFGTEKQRERAGSPYSYVKKLNKDSVNAPLNRLVDKGIVQRKEFVYDISKYRKGLRVLWRVGTSKDIPATDDQALWSVIRHEIKYDPKRGEADVWAAFISRTDVYVDLLSCSILAGLAWDDPSVEEIVFYLKNTKRRKG